MPLDRLEAAYGHLRRQDLQRFRVGKPAGQGFGEQCGIDPRLLGQGHHFGNDQGIARHDHLVASLGHLPCPHAAHVRHPLAEGQQHRARALKVHSLAADHDRQGTGLSSWRTAGHRSIQPGHATQRRQLSRHFPGRGGFQAGEVDQQLPAVPTLGDTLLTEHHLANH